MRVSAGLALGRRRERRRLDEQHVAAVAGDGEAGGHAGQLGALGHVVDDLGPPDPVGQVLGVERRQRLAGGDLGRRLAGEAAELALERAHAGLPRVAADDGQDGVVVDGQLVGVAGRPAAAAGAAGSGRAMNTFSSSV